MEVNIIKEDFVNHKNLYIFMMWQTYEQSPAIITIFMDALMLPH